MITKLSELRLQVGGAINPRTDIYIIRPSDEELPRLLERGEYANVFCSRQMGKTSLLKRTKARLFERGYSAAEIEVAGYLGSPADADEWYQGLLDGIAHQLRLNVGVTDWWEACRAITPNQRLIRFFRDEIAAKLPTPAVIFLDEIDSTLALPYTDDFFVAIRAMYNDRASEPLFDRITFCLVGVATPDELIKNRRSTSYNIGRTIELPDFDPARDDLRPLFGAVANDPQNGEAIVHAVLRWTGGHPYLTMRLCDQFVTKGGASPADVDEMVNKAFVSLDQLHTDVHFQQALRFLDGRVEDKLATLNLYRRIWQGEQVRDQTSPPHIALKLAGIVKRDRQGMLIVRNPIYRRIFTDEWTVSTTEADDRLREENATWRAMAGKDEEILRQVSDNYQTARGAYQSLRNNPTYTGNAEELLACFFERRALQAEQRQQSLLWQLKALTTSPTVERAKIAGSLIGSDYLQLAMTFHHRSFVSKFAHIPVTSVAFNSDGEMLLTGCTDGTARLWRTASGQQVGHVMKHESSVWAVAFSPNGDLALIGCTDGTAQLWHVTSGQPFGQPMKHELLVSSVSFSPGGEQILVGCYDGTARLWLTASCEPLGPPMEHPRLVNSVVFSPDGKKILVGCYDGTARLWDASSCQPCGQLMKHKSSVWSVDFSKDGSRLLTGCGDGTVQLWDAISCQPLGQPMRYDNSVSSVAFSPQGDHVLVGYNDGAARLLQVSSGQLLGQLIKHEGTVNSVAFSPDGRMILTGSDDGMARLWFSDYDFALAQFVQSKLFPKALGNKATTDKLATTDTLQLLKVWERRLGLRINEAGEISPIQ